MRTILYYYHLSQPRITIGLLTHIHPRHAIPNETLLIPDMTPPILRIEFSQLTVEGFVYLPKVPLILWTRGISHITKEDKQKLHKYILVLLFSADLI